MGATSRSGNSRADAPRPIVVLGNPENRRVRMFCEAARQLQLPPPRVIDYQTVLTQRIDPRAAVARGDCVRIESPGENEAVHRGLVAWGAAASGGDVPRDYDPAEPMEFGRIVFPSLWYRGFAGLMLNWEQALDPLPVAWMNHPGDIRLMFDKPACQQRLAATGIPVPPSLGPVKSYEDLRSKMRARGISRVFAKLDCGSSASGVVAFRVKGGQVSAITSVEVCECEGRLRLFNSLQVREYRCEQDVALLFDALGPLGLHAEAWIPKASCRDGVFDLRVVVIAGLPRHVVMRVAKSPLTNLHLGNRRGDVDAFLNRLQPQAREAAWDTCCRVARCFPRSLYLGIDLMFTASLGKHFVLEVNAFGDLLPGVLHQRQDTYTAEIQALRPQRTI